MFGFESKMFQIQSDNVAFQSVKEVQFGVPKSLPMLFEEPQPIALFGCTVFRVSPVFKK